MYRFSRAIFVEDQGSRRPASGHRQRPGGEAARAAVVRGDDRAAGPRSRTTSRSPARASSRRSATCSRSRTRRASTARSTATSARRSTYILEELERNGEGDAHQCKATTRKGKPCQRTPLPDREYCPSHQHLEERRRSPRQRRLGVGHPAATAAGAGRSPRRRRPPGAAVRAGRQRAVEQAARERRDRLGVVDADRRALRPRDDREVRDSAASSSPCARISPRRPSAPASASAIAPQVGRAAPRGRATSRVERLLDRDRDRLGRLAADRARVDARARGRAARRRRGRAAAPPAGRRPARRAPRSSRRRRRQPQLGLGPHPGQRAHGSGARNAASPPGGTYGDPARLARVRGDLRDHLAGRDAERAREPHPLAHAQLDQRRLLARVAVGQHQVALVDPDLLDHRRHARDERPDLPRPVPVGRGGRAGRRPRPGSGGAPRRCDIAERMP